MLLPNLILLINVTFSTPTPANNNHRKANSLQLQKKRPERRAAPRKGRASASIFPFAIATMAWSFYSSAYGRAS
jgi:hypothetical protein